MEEGEVRKLAIAGGAAAAGKWVSSNINQIKPSVRHQLRGNAGPRGFTGPQGPAGPAGSTGTAGPAGPAGIAGVVSVESAFVTLSAGSANGTFASCPLGDVALGGGWDGGSSPPVTAAVVGYDDPIGNNTAWDVVMTNDSGFSSTFAAVVECAPAGSGPAIAHASRATVEREAAQTLARVRARTTQ
jgi:hypothetical protein